MSGELIIAGTPSEIKDGLMEAFRAARKAGDYDGIAALSKELRKREKAENKEKRRAEKKDASAGSHPMMPR
jgi:hypothetical protein